MLQFRSIGSPGKRFAAALALFVMLLLPARALAQIPTTLNYQGTLRDDQGTLVTGTRTMTFRIYDAVIGGTKLHEETINNVSVRDGIFNVVLGDAKALDTNIFASAPRFIGITVSPDPQEMVPRQRLHPVPWAAQTTHAFNADLATNATNAVSAQVADTLIPNATLSTPLVINSGTTANPRGLFGLMLKSSGNGYTSGLYLNNENGNQNWSIHPDPGGAIAFEDRNNNKRYFAIQQDGWIVADANVRITGDTAAANISAVNVYATQRIAAQLGFSGRCGPSPGAVGLDVWCNSDVAETFGTDERIEAGNLVVFIPEDRDFPAVQRSDTPYQNAIVGVVSTNPGLVFDQGETSLSGDNSDLISDEKTVVAMVGRVPTRISLENGPIAVGDPLTSSSTPGAAMKATEAGMIIGYAMQSSDAADDDQILVWLQLGLYLPDQALAAFNRSTLATVDDSTVADLEAQVATLTEQVNALSAAEQTERFPWGLPLFGGILVTGLIVSTRSRFWGNL